MVQVGASTSAMIEVVGRLKHVGEEDARNHAFISLRINQAVGFSFARVDSPEAFADTPITLQLIGRRLPKEEVISLKLLSIHWQLQLLDHE